MVPWGVLGSLIATHFQVTVLLPAPCAPLPRRSFPSMLSSKILTIYLSTLKLLPHLSRPTRWRTWTAEGGVIQHAGHVPVLRRAVSLVSAPRKVDAIPQYPRYPEW